jgi:hypothetical protein
VAARELGGRWRQPVALDAWRPRGCDTLPVAAMEAATALLVIVQFFSPVSNPCADNIGQPTSEAATLLPASVLFAAWTLQVQTLLVNSEMRGKAVSYTTFGGQKPSTYLWRNSSS